MLVIVGVDVCAGGDEIDGHSCWHQGWRWTLVLVLATMLEVATCAGDDKSSGVLVMAASVSVIHGVAACADNARSRWQREQEQWMLMAATLSVTLVLGVMAAMVLVIVGVAERLCWRRERWTLVLVAF